MQNFSKIRKMMLHFPDLSFVKMRLKDEHALFQPVRVPVTAAVTAAHTNFADLGKRGSAQKKSCIQTVIHAE